MGNSFIKNKKKNYFKLKMLLKNLVLKSSLKLCYYWTIYIAKNNYEKIKKLKPGQGGEIHITDAIKQLIEDGENFMEIYLKVNI